MFNDKEIVMKNARELFKLEKDFLRTTYERKTPDSKEEVNDYFQQLLTPNSWFLVWV